jgi:predicted nucleic acid-binding protein
MIVVDASVAVKWFSSENGRLEALALLEGTTKLLAPALIRVEVAAALVKKARLGQISVEAAEGTLIAWHEAALGGSIVLVPDEFDLLEAGHLSLALQHPIYDCLYLALAKRHGIPLVTADANFVARAASLYPEIRSLV